MGYTYYDEDKKKKKKSQDQGSSSRFQMDSESPKENKGFFDVMKKNNGYIQNNNGTHTAINRNTTNNVGFFDAMKKNSNFKNNSNAYDEAIELNRKHYDSLHKNDNQNTNNADYSKIAELNRKHYEDRKNALESKDEIDVDQVLADNNVKRKDGNVSPKVQGIFDEAFAANDYRSEELKKAEENLNNVSPFDTDKAAYNKAMYDYERAKTDLDLSKNKEKYDAALESKAAELGLTEEEVEQLRRDTEQYNYGGEKLMHSLLGVGVNKLIPAPGVANSIARQANLNYDKQMLEDFDEDALKESIGNRGYQLLVERNRKNEDFAERNQIEKDKALDASANYLSINDNSSGITDTLDDTFYASMEEQQNYNYLYNTTYDKVYEEAINSGASEEEAKTMANSKANEEANKYLDTLGLDAKRTAMFAGFSKEYAEEHPILATASSIAFKPLEAIGQIDNALKYIGGNPNDENSLANLPAQMNTTMRGTVRSNIDNPLLKFGYDVGTSMGDMVLSNRLGFGNNNLSLILMGGEAANETYTQLLNEGYTKTDAMVMSTVAGGAEIITEKIPMEEIFSADKKGIRQILKSALFEGVEEVESDVINDIADILYSQLSDRGQIKSEIEAYMAKGMSEEDAQYAVFNDHLKQAAYDFGAGAGSGGLANAYHGAVTTAVGMKNTNQLSEEAQKTIANIAVNSKDSKLAKLAEKVVNGTANAYEKYKTVRDTIDENNIGQQIENKLIDEGVSKKEVEEAKAAIVKTIAQVDLTEDEYDIAQSEPVRKVLSDITKGDLDAAYERQLAVNDALKLTKNNVNSTQTQNVTPSTETAENGAENNVETADESKKVVALSNYARNAQQRLGTMPIESLNDIQDVVNDEEGNIQIVTNDGNKVNNPYVKNRALGVVINNATTLFNDGASAKSYIQNFDPAMNLKAYNTITTEMIKAGKADAGTDKSTLISTVKSLQNMGGDVGYYAKKLPASFFNDMYAYGVKEENQRSEVVASDPQRNVINAIASQFSNSGLNITIEDNNTEYNGKLVGTNNLVLSSHADKALMSVLSHELTHYFKKKTNLYNDYEKAVIDFLKESGQYEELVKAKKKQGYADNEIDEEIVADAAENFLSDKKVIDRVCKNDKNLANKIISWLNQTIKDLKKLFGSADPRTAEGRIMKNLEKQNLAKYEEIRDLWVNAYEAATKADQSAKAADVLQGKGEVKNSLKNMSDAELQTDYDKALKAGNEELAAQIVEQYANNKGFTERLYHGTQNFGFTKLDPSIGDDGISFFATNKPSIASSYSGVEGKRGISEEEKISDDELVDYLKRRRHFRDVREFKAGDKKARIDYFKAKWKSLSDFARNNQRELNERGGLYKAYEKLSNALFDTLIYDKFNDSNNRKELNVLLKPLKEASYGITDYVSRLSEALLLLRDSNINKHAFILDGNMLKTAEQVREQYLPLDNWGNYELFANTDNMLEIDGRGDNWNTIHVEKPRKTYTPNELLKMLKESSLYENVSYSEDTGMFTLNGTERDKGFVERVLNVADWQQSTYETVSTRELAKRAREQGYKGVIIRNITDDGGRNWNKDFINEHGDVYIFFEPQSQCKSADTVTYDDQGNVIPLSERFNEENDDIRFSMKQPVETKKNLMAIHNLDINKLMKAFELGGFAMPSIAVVKANEGHTKYGDYSAILRRDSIDPRKSTLNKIYGSDAYTPTTPQVDYLVDSKRVTELTKTLRELSEKVDDYFSHDIRSFLSFAYEGESNLSYEEILNKALESKGMKAAYLESIGKHINPVQEEVEETLSFDGKEDFYKKILDTYSEERKNDMHELTGKEYMDKYSFDDIKEALEKNLGKKFPENSKFAEQVIRRNFFNLRDYHQYLKGELKPKKWMSTNAEMTNKAIEENIDKAEYKKWLQNILDGVINGAGIYNGKDLFTNDGSRRSFWQTHSAYTLDNLVAAMRKLQSARGEKASMTLAQGLQSVLSPEFKSITELKKNTDKLGQKEEAEYEAILKGINDRIREITTYVGENSELSRYVSLHDLLDEAILKSIRTNSVESVIKNFEKENLKISEEMAQKLLDIFEDVKNIPSGYFEAKPQRAVGFDEVAYMVIPDDAPQEIIDNLNKYNVPYETYKAGDDSDRIAKLNSHDDVKFSKKAPVEDNQGRKLTDAQRKLFENVSDEVKDSKGNLKVYYHGTETPGFTVFNPSNRKGFTDNYNAIYVTDSLDVAKTYTINENKKGDSVYPLYVKAENPYVVDVKGQSFHNWRVDKYAKHYIDVKLEGVGDADRRFAYWHESDDGGRKLHYGEFSLDELVKKFGEKIGIFDFDYDTWLGSIYLDENGNNIPTSTDDCVLHAKNNGYDSVVFNNIRDMGRFAYDSEESQVVALLNPNQVKSVKNENPTENPDIRYSKKMLDDIGVKLSNKYSDADEMFFSEDTWENSEAQTSAKNTADILKEGFNDLQKLKEAGKAHFTHADALRLAEKYQREYGTSTGKEYIANNIESIFAYIENNRDNVRYDDMLRVMRDAAMPIVEKQSNALDEYDDFRKYVKDLNIRLNDQQRAEVINTYGSMKTFRKAIGSRINVTDNGQNIDSLWQDICEASGYYLDPDENSNTQILALADALDSMRDIGDNSGMSTSDKAYDLALNIYTDYFKLNGVENITKQMKKQIEDYKAASEKAYKEIINKQKEESKIQLDKLRSELKRLEAEKEIASQDKIERADIDKELDRYRQRILKLKDEILVGKAWRRSARLKAAESRQKTILRNRIKSIVNDLSKRLTNPTEGHHVPEGLVNATIDVLQNIDLNTGKSVNMAEKLRKLSEKYEAVRKGYDGENPDYDPTLQKMIDQLGKMFEGRSIAKLSQNELEEVFTICKALQTQIRNMSKFIDSQIKEDIYKTGKNIIEDVNTNKGVGEGKLANMANSYLTASVNAERFFNRLSGYKDDSALNKLYDDLNEGSHKMMQIEFDVSDIMKNVLEGDENQKLADKFKGDNKKDWIETPWKDKNGNTIKVPQSFRASLFMHMMNDQNMKHIMYGGFTLPNEKLYQAGKIKDAYTRGTTVKLVDTTEMREILKQINETESVDERNELWKKYNEAKDKAEKAGKATLKNFLTDMTPYERDWCRYAARYFHDYSGKKINETSLKLNGYAKAVVDNYFPIKTDPSFTRSDMEGVKLDATIEGWGNLKERVNGSNPIVIEGIDRVLNAHSKMLAKYVGMAIPIRNFNKVYGVTLGGYIDSVKKAIGSKFGERSNKFINDLFTDLQTSRTRDDALSKVMNTIRSNYAQAVLTTNLSVAWKQAASYPTAAAELGWDAIGKTMLSKAGLTDAAELALPMWLKKNTKEIMETAEKYTPLLKYRNLGNSTQELGDLKKQRTWLQKNKVTGKPVEWLTNWIQNIDTTTVASLWKASEYRVAKDNANLQPGTDEFYKEVAKVFNKAVERTQPNYTVLQRPDILRSPNEFLKQVFMFKTQPLQNLGIMIDATGNLKAKVNAYKADPSAENKAKVDKARKQFRRALTSQVAAAATFSAMTLAVNALLHNLNGYRDDDKELTLEAILKKYFKDVGGAMAGSLPLGTELYDRISSWVTGDKWYDLSVSSIDTINNIIKDIDKIYNADSTTKTIESTKKLIKDTSMLYGIPLGNIEKIYNGGKYHIEDIKNNEFGSFEAGVDRTTKQNNNRLYEAMKEGDWDKFDKIYADMDYDKVIKGSSSVTNMIKADYMDGNISEETAEKYLKELDFSDDDAHFKVQEWEHADEEGGSSDYVEVFDAIESYDTKAIIKSVNEMKKYGYDNEKLQKASIAAQYKDKYIELYKTNKTEAANLKSAILTYYQACGKDREKASKQVDNWVK